MPEFTEQDLRAFEEHGVSAEEVRRQIDLFLHPPPFADLVRPCTPGDGIRILRDDEKASALEAYEEARAANRLSKMVPASGAASRMFQSLLRYYRAGEKIDRKTCEEAAAAGDEAAGELIRFIDGVSRFPFHEMLTGSVDGGRAGGEEAARRFDVLPLLTALLAPDRLDSASLPKGLIPFHAYEDGVRTPFEEHLVEGALYGANGNRSCAIHFTVSPEHRERFTELLARAAPAIGKRFAVSFDVGFSEQKKSTDTVAVDPENNLFRNDDGSVLFRPGGHGALIENLNDLEGDIVLIKNIDNVSPGQLDEHLVVWKKYLAGHAARLQKEMFRHRAALADAAGGEPDGAALEEALRFARDELNIAAPEEGGDGGARSLAERLIERFDRPLRVCGMVVNTGAPGGGPFWVRGSDGSVTAQIVESAHVDSGSPDQEAIFASATHFNPVDLACAVRDHEGKPYDLTRFVDENAVFISHKSKDGRALKALERPGLWNGAMAHWNTVFIEVPAETFTPVKRVTDLLDDVHQKGR